MKDLWLQQFLACVLVLGIAGCPGCPDGSTTKPSGPVGGALNGLKLTKDGSFCCQDGISGEQVVGQIIYENQVDAGVQFVSFDPPAFVEIRPKPEVAEAVWDGGTPTKKVWVVPKKGVGPATFDVVVTACPDPSSVPDPWAILVDTYTDLDNDGKFDPANADRTVLNDEEDLHVDVVQLCAMHTPSTGGGGLFPDLAVYPTYLTGTEGVVRSTERGTSGSSSVLGTKVWVAGSNGFIEEDLADGSSDSSNTFVGTDQGSRYGAVPLRYENGGVVEEGVFIFGPDGAVRAPWINGAWATFWETTLFGQNVTDAWYLTGKEFGHEIVVAYGSLETYYFNGATGLWEQTEVATTGKAVAGWIVTGAARSLNGPQLLVTDGTPGGLWLHSGDATASATYIGDVGDSPRRIRGAGNLAVVSNFGSDSLTLIRWVEGGTTEILQSIGVGDGPVGIDVRQIPQGIAIVSTGYNDGTYTVTLVDPTSLAVVSNETRDVPAGVTNPGHAIWLDDTHIAITGNTSNSVAVLDVSSLLP